MANGNQLKARVSDSHIDAIGSLSEKRGISETDAERVVVKNGLTRLGYLDEQDERCALLAEYAEHAEGGLDVDAIQELSDQGLIPESEANRAIIRHGLSQNAAGEPAGASDRLLEYAQRSGSVLGFSGLILIGWGIFGLASFSYIGFGLVTAGFALIAGSQFGPALRARFSPDADTESGEIAT